MSGWLCSTFSCFNYFIIVLFRCSFRTFLIFLLFKCSFVILFVCNFARPAAASSWFVDFTQSDVFYPALIEASQFRTVADRRSVFPSFLLFN